MNMSLMSVTFDVSQAEMSWLKVSAPANMSAMLVTFEVSQVEMSWLNELADANMPFMSVTLEVSQASIDGTSSSASQPWNAEWSVVGGDKSGRSMALTVRFVQKAKAPGMLPKRNVPHCLISANLVASDTDSQIG